MLTTPPPSFCGRFRSFPRSFFSPRFRSAVLCMVLAIRKVRQNYECSADNHISGTFRSNKSLQNRSQLKVPLFRLLRQQFSKLCPVCVSDSLGDLLLLWVQQVESRPSHPIKTFAVPVPVILRRNTCASLNLKRNRCRNLRWKKIITTGFGWFYYWCQKQVNDQNKISLEQWQLIVRRTRIKNNNKNKIKKIFFFRK